VFLIISLNPSIDTTSKTRVISTNFSGDAIIETMSRLEYGLRIGYFKPADIDSIQPWLDSLYISINRLMKSLKIQFSP